MLAEPRVDEEKVSGWRLHGKLYYDLGHATREKNEGVAIAASSC